MHDFDLALILLFGFLVAGITIRRLSVLQAAEPACGKCGYSVRKLPTTTCPECGSDLAQVGVLTTSSWVQSLSSIIVELLSVAVILALALIIIANTVPIPRLYRWNWTTTLTPADPTPGYRFELYGRLYEWHVIGPTQTVTAPRASPSLLTIVRWRTASTSSTDIVEIDLQSQQFTFENTPQGHIHKTGAFTPVQAATWLQLIGITDPSAAEQARLLSECVALGVDSSAIQQHFDQRWEQGQRGPLLFGGAGSGSGVISDQWFQSGGILIAGLLWLAYARRMFRPNSPRLQRSR